MRERERERERGREGGREREREIVQQLRRHFPRKLAKIPPNQVIADLVEEVV